MSGTDAEPTRHVLADPQSLQAFAADRVCEVIRDAAERRGVCRIALSGGSTPKGLYRLLAGRELPWETTHWFWGDERNVAADHPDSNARMVREALLDHVPIPRENVHPVPVNPASPAAAAEAYEATLREAFGDSPWPEWDLTLLGMGDDAHTASLFPETAAIGRRDRWFLENWVEKLGTYRYTLTVPAINSGREIWFLVAGEGKREAYRQVTGAARDPHRYPAQSIRPTRWLVTTDVLGDDHFGEGLPTTGRPDTGDHPHTMDPPQ